MISKTRISAQKPRGRQQNAKVCGKKSAIFLILPFFVTTTLFKQRYLENLSSTHRHFITKLMHITSHSSKTTQCLHSCKLTLVDTAVLISVGYCVLHRTPFSNVRMHTRSLVPKPKTTVIGLGTRL